MSILRGPETIIKGIGICEGPFKLAEYTVTTVPDATAFTGHLIYVSNGAGGAEVVAFSDGTDWLRVDTLAAIAAI